VTTNNAYQLSDIRVAKNTVVVIAVLIIVPVLYQLLEKCFGAKSVFECGAGKEK
jgi:hypothetical protein